MKLGHQFIDGKPRRRNVTSLYAEDSRLMTPVRPQGIRTTVLAKDLYSFEHYSASLSQSGQYEYRQANNQKPSLIKNWSFRSDQTEPEYFTHNSIYGRVQSAKVRAHWIYFYKVFNMSLLFFKGDLLIIILKGRAGCIVMSYWVTNPPTSCFIVMVSTRVSSLKSLINSPIVTDLSPTPKPN